MKSLYWVFTLKCNDVCDHCYNHSGPAGEVLDTQQLLRVVANLPDRAERIILSGGEPLVEMDKLVALLGALRQRYSGHASLGLQTNGDLLNDRRLQRLLAADIVRFDITSLDRYHRAQGQHRARLEALFARWGIPRADAGDADGGGDTPPAVYAMWGANEDIWLGGNWARGRALTHGHALLDPDHNFCALWSGALGFLDDGSDQQEVHIQLSRLYPCCPMTLFDLGDVREAPVAALLDQVRELAAFQRLNRGDICGLGLEQGLTTEYIRARIEALGDVCLWCDEFFDQHYDGPRGGRRHEPPSDLRQIGAA